MKIKEEVAKIKEKLKISKVYDNLVFIIEFLLSLIIGVSIYKITYTYQDFHYVSLKYLIVFAVNSLLNLLLIISNIVKYKNIIEKLFLTFIIPIGIAFLMLFPMNQVPDEDGHMFRIYNISLGNFITAFGENNEGEMYVPKVLSELSEQKEEFTYSDIHRYMINKSNYDELVPVQAITKTYNPISYLTGAFTFFMCRLLNVNILLTCYLIRLINFMFFVIAGYYCIKTIPFGKLLLAIYMFLPMIIQQAASLSVDSFVNTVSLLFIVYTIKLLYQKNDLFVKQRIIYYVLAIGIALSKYIYFPLTFMSIMLLWNKNIKKKNSIKLIITSITLSVLLSGAWFLFSQKYVDVRENIINNNVNPMEQIKYIIKNPIQYLLLFMKNIERNGQFYVFSFVGSQLGWLNIIVPGIYITMMLYGLLILPFLEKNEKSLQKQQKFITTLIGIILIILIITGLYITWTGVGVNDILGVQGRYFIPAVILILLSMIKEKQYINVKNIELKYFITYFILNALVLITAFKQFI